MILYNFVNDDDEKLIIVKEKARTIKNIFDLYSQGDSILEIIKK